MHSNEVAFAKRKRKQIMFNVLFLLNDSPLINEINSISGDHGDINIVGWASDPSCATHYLSKNNIDVTVLDMTLAFLDSPENIHQFIEGATKASVDIKWIAITAAITKLLPLSLKQRYGCVACVDLTISASELFQILRLVSKGYFVCKIEEDASNNLFVQAETDETDEKHLTQFSQRETQILCLLAQGLPNRDIATAIGLSEGTVKNHTSSIFNRLGLKGRTQAALWARNHFPATIP